MVYANDSSQFDDATEVAHKPTIAVMGEFSAGKSTLCNLILGEPVLPTKVTATQLPPVWISEGEEPPRRIDHDGEDHELDIEAIHKVRPDETRFVRVHKRSELLSLCELIDMPGISDPNMSSEVWENLIGHADAVIWCTHATQAWRQSEAAVWQSLPDKLKEASLLLLTRFDKLKSESDRQRVLQRVEKETDGMFRGIFPISLVDAMEAGDDPDKLRASGAEQLAHGIVALMGDIGAVGDKASEADEADEAEDS